MNLYKLAISESNKEVIKGIEVFCNNQEDCIWVPNSKQCIPRTKKPQD